MLIQISIINTYQLGMVQLNWRAVCVTKLVVN